MKSGDITEDKLLPSDLDDRWAWFDQMTAADKHAAAVSDADAQPINADNVRLMRRTPQVRVIRRALGLTLDAFAARFHIPVDMLKVWERGVTQPERPPVPICL